MTKTIPTAPATPKPATAAASKKDDKENDPLYIKAKNEIDGHTLVPLAKIGKNHTVKRVGDAVYGDKTTGEMVVAKRLTKAEQDETEADAE